MMQVIKDTEEHVEHEEKTWLPKFASSLTTAELEALGTKFTTAKAVVPTRPHPAAPANPPMNMFNVLATPIDKIRDAVQGRK